MFACCFCVQARESSDEDTSFGIFGKKKKKKRKRKLIFFKTGAFDAVPVEVFWGMCSLHDACPGPENEIALRV